MATRHVLAGDIGGTKTHLALYAVLPGLEPTLVRDKVFPSRGYPSLEAVIQAFVEPDHGVTSAVFGIAGPVVDNAVLATNLPWHVTPKRLSAVLGRARIGLLNDLEATAVGALGLAPSHLHVLQPGTERRGHIAVVAAGTGLGQAQLFWDGTRHRPGATEGGHADFGPSTDQDAQLLAFARRHYGHVSWERFVSGPGLHFLFRFLTEVEGKPIAADVAGRLDSEDPSAVVGEAGVAGTCETSREAVDWFVRLYGAQAGNFALSILSLGGVLLGGGIVGRLLPRIENGPFLEAFCDKGRYRDLLRQMPIRAILEPRTALFGAARAAVELLGAE